MGTGSLLSFGFGVTFMPWNLLSTSDSYIYRWLTAYGIFLGPIAGIMVSDFYLFKKRKLDLKSLYHFESSQYYYRGGFNLTALFIFIISVVPAMFGFISYTFPNSFVVQTYPILFQSSIAKSCFSFSFILGFFIAFGLYSITNSIKYCFIKESETKQAFKKP